MKWWVPLRHLLAMLMVIIVLLPFDIHAQISTTMVNSTAGNIPNSNSGGSCNNIITRSFNITTPGTIKDVNLTAVITHSRRRDIRLDLQSPGGTQNVTLINNRGGNADNLNVLFDNQAVPPTSINSHNGNDAIGPTPNNRFIPSPGSLDMFNNLDTSGTWNLRICDLRGGQSGSFVRADLNIIRFNADLSLTKSVSNAAPRTGEIINYNLTVTNDGASEITASGISVTETLPPGLSLINSTPDPGSSFSGGLWTVGSLAAGQTRSLNLTIMVTAPAGTIIDDDAEIITSSEQDADSTVANGNSNEDDFATVRLTILGAPGTPPDLANGICRAAGVGTTLLDWDNFGWTSGQQNYSRNLPNIGMLDFTVTTSSIFASPLQVNGANDGGFGRDGSLHQNLIVPSGGQITTTVLTLQSAVPGLQFTLFDVDGNPLNVRDRITITGSFNGTAVTPILTSGSTHIVSGNQATGFILSPNGSANGNLVVTFDQPVDTITIIYEGLVTLSAGGLLPESISIFDISFCNPTTVINVTKSSETLSDGVSITNPKAIPGATVRYCLFFSNDGSATATNVVATDPLPPEITFIPGTLFSGPDCTGTNIPEDDDPFDPPASEPDGVGAAGSAQNILVQIYTIIPGQSFAVAYNVEIQ